MKKSGNFKIEIISDWMELFLYCLSSSDQTKKGVLQTFPNCCAISRGKVLLIFLNIWAFNIPFCPKNVQIAMEVWDSFWKVKVNFVKYFNFERSRYFTDLQLLLRSLTFIDFWPRGFADAVLGTAYLLLFLLLENFFEFHEKSGHSLHC